MEEKRKRPPAYYRYKEKHPTINVVITSELKDAIDKRKVPGTSYGQFIKNLLTKRMDEVVEDARKDMIADRKINEHKRGYEAGKADWQIWFNCDECGKKIFIEPLSYTHKSVIKYMREMEWGHAWCHR